MNKILMIDPNNEVPYYNYSLLKSLKAIGWNVEYITSPFTADANFAFLNINVNNFFFKLTTKIKPKSNVYWFYKYYRLLKGVEYCFDIIRLYCFIKFHSPAIIHLQWLPIPVIDNLWIRAIKGKNCKIILTVHNILPHETGLGDPQIYGVIYKMVDHLIVHSQNDKNILTTDFGADKNKISVVPMGNCDIYAVDETVTKDQARVHLGVKTGNPVVLYFGLIRPYKGVEVLLRSWPKIIEQIPEACLIVAGKMLVPVGKLDDLLNSKNIIKNLKYIPFKEVQYYFKAADLVVLPYIESYNSAIIQLAYSFAVPVIATKVGGLSEVVEVGKSGYLIEPNNAVELEKAVVTALGNMRHLTVMGGYARQLADTKYSWGSIAKKTISVYQTLSTTTTSNLRLGETGQNNM